MLLVFSFHTRNEENMNIDKIVGVVAPVDEAAVEAELVAYITGMDVETAGEPWRIENVGQADWALRKLIETQAAYGQYADEISLWEAARKRAKHAIDFFTELLQAWAIGARTKDTKSFALAHGTVSTRQSAARLSISDKDAILEWAATNAPDAIKVTSEVQLSLLTNVTIEVMLVGERRTNMATGEIVVDNREPVLLTDEALATVGGAGSGWQVEPITLQMAVADGKVVPGMTVVPAKVTASVTALGV